MVLNTTSVTSLVSGRSKGWDFGGQPGELFMRLETEFDGLQVTLGFREWDYRGLKCCKGSPEGYVGVLGPL